MSQKCECLDHCRMQPGRQCVGLQVAHRSDGSMAESPSNPMTIEALADKLEAVSSLGGYIMESKEAAQIVTALRSISSLSAETASTDAAKTCNSYLERALAAEYELDKAVSEITRLSAATAQEAVAWRIKNDFGHWHPTCNKALADTWRDIEKMDVQPLYLSAVGGS
jgi:hypothetical protein